VSAEVKMSHDEDRGVSEIRFILDGEERQLDGVARGMIFGAGQPPEIRAEFLANHLKALVEKANAAKKKAKELAKQLAAEKKAAEQAGSPEAV